MKTWIEFNDGSFVQLSQIVSFEVGWVDQKHAVLAMLPDGLPKVLAFAPTADQAAQTLKNFMTALSNRAGLEVVFANSLL
ncbi:MAG: hypothetical protein LC772_06845 [Chloroflexi bacterium]|nr:hypothetical protein [Chloroflexota bacterium]